MNDDDRDNMLAAAVRLRTEGHQEEARQRLLSLSADFPADAEVAYQTAWAHDVLGLEAEAVPFYERCLAGTGLSQEDRRGALLGLGSTYRVLGQYEKAVEVLRGGAEQFPDNGALRTFLAMALFNTGEHHEAMRLLLELLAAGSTDPYVRRYRAAIEHYARDLHETV
ncbi:tetratricopeptide repeat protein [Streptomyces sp. NBC_01363]|uniref:tetratricopeptide repeat protein n=1 Tax=Streptomyces sp. NBC_01363 TaxID=2903840 RepID=UPI0022586917|nr:tetratricopeptide repeat protein [Streptomyces sp. NBC_01363]MCX4736075.1 tetratricopeptide repeat protein [Streptomyces sp. NBC_01363]